MCEEFRSIWFYNKKLTFIPIKECVFYFIYKDSIEIDQNVQYKMFLIKKTFIFVQKPRIVSYGDILYTLSVFYPDIKYGLYYEQHLLKHYFILKIFFKFHIFFVW